MQETTYKEVLKELKATYKKQALSIQETADVIGVNISTLRQGIKQGKNVPDYRCMGGGEKRKRVIFPIYEVAKFLANTQQVF